MLIKHTKSAELQYGLLDSPNAHRERPITLSPGDASAGSPSYTDGSESYNLVETISTQMVKDAIGTKYIETQDLRNAVDEWLE